MAVFLTSVFDDLESDVQTVNDMGHGIWLDDGPVTGLYGEGYLSGSQTFDEAPDCLSILVMEWRIDEQTIGASARQLVEEGQC